MYIKIVKLDTVDSTNNYARNIACDGAKEITVVRADMQQNGRGRMGKHWSSPKNGGIYASFVLRPSVAPKDIYYLPLFFSLAVVRFLNGILCGQDKTHALKKDTDGLKECKPQEARIKIPNDVILNGKKIAGVLVEAKLSEKQTDFIVAGIGVNINSKQRALPPKATSLYLETGKCYNIDNTFRSLVKEVINVYKDFKSRDINGLLEEVSICREDKSLKKRKEFFTNEKQVQGAVQLI